MSLGTLHRHVLRRWTRAVDGSHRSATGWRRGIQCRLAGAISSIEAAQLPDRFTNRTEYHPNFCCSVEACVKFHSLGMRQKSNLKHLHFTPQVRRHTDARENCRRLHLLQRRGCHVTSVKPRKVVAIWANRNDRRKFHQQETEIKLHTKLNGFKI
jgi:hypothetical protein